MWKGMSLGKIEQYIKKLEAVKNYDKIKAERDSLIAWVTPRFLSGSCPQLIH